MSDYDPPVLQTFALPPRTSLARYPRARPLPAQQHIIDSAVAQARRAGLRLPAHLKLEYYDARGRDVQHGEAVFHRDGAVTIRLDISIFPDELHRVLLHELQHAADALDPQARTLPYVELERRAVEFAAKQLGWR